MVQSARLEAQCEDDAHASPNSGEALANGHVVLFRPCAKQVTVSWDITIAHQAAPGVRVALRDTSKGESFSDHILQAFTTTNADVSEARRPFALPRLCAHTFCMRDRASTSAPQLESKLLQSHFRRIWSARCV